MYQTYRESTMHDEDDTESMQFPKGVEFARLPTFKNDLSKDFKHGLLYGSQDAKQPKTLMMGSPGIDLGSSPVRSYDQSLP